MEITPARYWERAEEACSKASINLTSKRRLVLLYLFTTHKALSPYEIADKIVQDYQKTISPMSIYRLLNFLERNRLVRKLRSMNKYIMSDYDFSENAGDISQFLICSQCSAVKEIRVKPEAIDLLRSKIADSGFQLKTPEMEIECLCST
ncbi:MAG TPA: transcriptional repressor, partial [Cellvibrio sp.]|nr:transcriptional repressor [Cellvibrio sp.]